MASMTICERRNIESVDSLMKRKKISAHGLVHSRHIAREMATSRLPPPSSICSDHERYAWIKNRMEQTKLDKELNHIRIQKTLQGRAYSKEKHVVRARSAQLTYSAHKMRRVLDVAMSKSKLVTGEKNKEREEQADDSDDEKDAQDQKASGINKRPVMHNGWLYPRPNQLGLGREQYHSKSSQDADDVLLPRQVVFASGLRQQDRLSNVSSVVCSHVVDFSPQNDIVDEKREITDSSEEDADSASTTDDKDSVFEVLHKTKAKQQSQGKSLLERLANSKLPRPKTAPEMVTSVEQEDLSTVTGMETANRPAIRRYKSMYSSRALSLAQLRKDLKHLQENRSVVKKEKPKLEDFLTCEKLRFQGCQSRVDVFCQKLSDIQKNRNMWNLKDVEKKLNLL